MSCLKLFKLSKNKSECEIIKKPKKIKQSKTDSKWGWIIVASSFLIQLIIDGTLSGYGVLYLSLRNDEVFISANYSQTILSLPGTIQPGFFLCTGAFVSPLIRMFGFRISGCFGAFLLGFGMSVASYLNNIHAFTIFYGIVSGSGFGILMVCAIVAVNYYFDRYRGIASGIAMSGAGIGTLSIPVLYNWIMPIKGWRLSLLMYSLTVGLLTALASLTFKPFITSNVDSDAEFTEQSVIVEEMKINNPDEICVMKNIPEIQCFEEKTLQSDEIINPNRTGDIIIQSNGKLDESTLQVIKNSTKEESEEINEPNGPASSDREKSQLNIDACDKLLRDSNTKKERKISIGFTNALRQFLLNQKDLPASSENASDVGEEGAEEDDDDTESTVGSRLWKSSLGFKQSKPSYKTSRQLNKPECDHVKRIRRMTTTTDSHGYDPIHYSNHVITPVKKTRRKQFMSQFSTPFDKPDAFYSASLANLNPRSSQILVAYKKSICTTTNPYSKGLTSLHSSKPSLIYLTNEPMSKKRSTTDFISSNMSIQSFSTSMSNRQYDQESLQPPLPSQHQQQQHQQQQMEQLTSFDNQIFKSTRSNIFSECDVIPEEELFTTTTNNNNKLENYRCTVETEYPTKMPFIYQPQRYLITFGQRTIKLFDLGLFTEMSFLYLIGIGITSQLAYFIPYVYLIDCAISYGMEQDRAVIIVMILSKAKHHNGLSK
uniref:MFS domain-containing protein n=1 Tax=Trichobilharzia regenti TaxID=157069 RepID=A0AA85IMJ3_TRIRE|nr:unnamed protein product [Trichobilharzia regenti]